MTSAGTGPISSGTAPGAAAAPAAGLLYRVFFSVVLRRLDAETVHHLTFRLLRLLQAVPGAVSVLRRLCVPREPGLGVQALGLDFPGPLGLAAGFDKDARAYDVLGAFGFAFVEVGTLTAEGQPGNPRPRLFRLPADAALLNRLGFNNGGSAAAASRLRRRRRGRGIVGVNLGKTKNTPPEDTVADYVASAERIAELADYVVVNVSSPNTPGLRDLQAVEQLRPLLVGVREALDRSSPARRVPLLVKVAPDLADADVDAIADLALALGLDGIVATNTTISRDGLRTPSAEVAALGAGGISGGPVRERALEVLRRLHARVGDRLVLVGVGGVSTAADVQERLDAGATLVQAYTGLVYGGPLWPRRVHRELARATSGPRSSPASTPATSP